MTDHKPCECDQVISGHWTTEGDEEYPDIWRARLDIVQRADVVSPSKKPGRKRPSGTRYLCPHCGTRFKIEMNDRGYYYNKWDHTLTVMRAGKKR